MRSPRLWKHAPLGVALGVYALSIVCIRPWGDYPISDDWVYAHIAKVFAETGVFRYDPPAAPVLLGQSLLVAPFIHLFGFSHVLLRIISLTLGAVALALFSGILGLFAITPRARTIALFILAANPLFLYLSLTFMTEIYGTAPMLLAAYIWLRDRRRHENNGEPATVSWTAVLLAAVLSGYAFWTRQFYAMGFPCLAFAMLVRAWASGQGKRALRMIPRLAMGTAVLLLNVKLYFVWARSTGNLKSEFTGPLSLLTNIDLASPLFYLPLFVIYLTAFCAPLLSGFLQRGQRSWTFLVSVALAWSALAAAVFYKIADRMPGNSVASHVLNTEFPFIGNTIRNAGISTFSLTDVYLDNLPGGPAWPQSIWNALLIGLCLLSAIWLVPLWREKRGFMGPDSDPAGTMRKEIGLFGLSLALGNAYVVTKAFDYFVYDRYLLITLYGMVLFLASAAPLFEQRWTRIFAYASLAALWLFTVAGLYDSFRFNDVRWDLYRSAKLSGIAGEEIDGGSEINGWTSFEEAPGGTLRRAADCPVLWLFCHRARYQIVMHLRDGERPVLEREIPFVMGRAAPIWLVEKIKRPRR